MFTCYSRNFRAIGCNTSISEKVKVIVQFCTIGPGLELQTLFLAHQLKHSDIPNNVKTNILDLFWHFSIKVISECFNCKHRDSWHTKWTTTNNCNIARGKKEDIPKSYELALLNDKVTDVTTTELFCPNINYWLRNIFLVHHHFFPSFSIFSISFRFVLFLYSDALLLVWNYEFWIWPDIRHSKLKFSSSLPNFSQSYRPLKFCILSLQKSRQTYYYTFTPPTLFAFIIHHLGTILPRSYNSSVPNLHASNLIFPFAHP